jgi:single-stranded-DNA-specific exonuclease
LNVAGVPVGADLRASDLGFKLAPRLNAAGRLGCARLVVDLLTTTDAIKANDLARFLEDQNGKRQSLEREMLRSARDMVEGEGLVGRPALVLSHPQWHAGVIGIVASRLVDLYGRPALLIALKPAPDDDPTAPVVGLGSGRSVPGFPLNEALEACSPHLLSHGGHKAAAGFKVLAENIGAFREAFCDYAARHFPAAGPPAPTITLDAEVPLASLTVSLVKDLDRLEPYGADNRKPVFLAGDLAVDGEPRLVGQGSRHLSFRVRQNGISLKAIAFGMCERGEELMSAGGACSLAFTPKINEWNGRRSVDLEVVDLQAGARARLG